MPRHLTLLGPRTLEGTDRDGPPAVLTQPKRLALVAYLSAQRPGRWTSRAELLGLLWPEHDETRARKALSQALWGVGQDLGDDALEKRGADEVRLDEAAVHVDVRAWLEAEGTGDLEHLASLYRGPFLEGFHLAGAPAFERWMDETRSALRFRALRVFQALAEQALDQSDAEQAAAWAERGLDAASPFDEDALRAGMALLARAGQIGPALERFRAFARHLEAEGDEPAEATRDLAARLEDAWGSTPPAADGAERPSPPRPVEREPRAENVGDANGRRRAPRRSRWRGPSAVLALVLVASAVAWWRGGRQAPAGPRTVRVAVAPFEYRGVEDRAYLGPALAELVGQRIDGAGGVRVADPHTVSAELARRGTLTPDLASSGLLRALRVESWVRGSVVATADGIEVHAWIHGPDGERRREASASATGERTVFDAVDELAAELLAALAPDGGGLLAPAGRPATRSLEALRSYLRGEESFQALRFADAATAYREAVQHDSTFALAHYRLSRALDWLDGGPEVLEAQARAVAHADRLPDRTRRLLHAYSAFWERDMAVGLAEFEALTADYPLDAEAWFQLGDARFHGVPRLGGPVDESGEPFERALELRPDDRRTALHLLALAARDRNPSRARDLAARITSDDPVWQVQVAALARWSTGERVRPREADSLLTAVPDGRVLSAVLSPSDFLEEPELVRAAARRHAVSQDPATRATGHTLAALADVAEGRPGAAAHSVTALLALDAAGGRRLAAYLASLPWLPNRAATRFAGLAPLPELSDLDAIGVFLEGASALRTGRRARADSALRALERIPPDVARQWPSLLGALLLEADGEPARALASIEEYRGRGVRLADMPGGPVPDGGLERLTRARLLEAVGRTDEALRWYGSIPAPVSHSLVYAAPAHLARARLLDVAGRRSEAEVARARAARIWRDCEPDLEGLLLARTGQDPSGSPRGQGGP